MARPRRGEAEPETAVKALAEMTATGSRRAKANALAERVATLAVAQLIADDFEAAMAKALAITTTPALAALAYDEDGAAMGLLHREALVAFQRRGCRHAEPWQRSQIDAQIKAAMARRLARRYREILPK